jgi:hypothetical protein
MVKTPVDYPIMLHDIRRTGMLFWVKKVWLGCICAGASLSALRVDAVSPERKVVVHDERSPIFGRVINRSNESLFAFRSMIFRWRNCPAHCVAVQLSLHYCNGKILVLNVIFPADVVASIIVDFSRHIPSGVKERLVDLLKSSGPEARNLCLIVPLQYETNNELTLMEKDALFFVIVSAIFYEHNNKVRAIAGMSNAIMQLFLGNTFKKANNKRQLSSGYIKSYYDAWRNARCILYNDCIDQIDKMEANALDSPLLGIQILVAVGGGSGSSLRNGISCVSYSAL